MQIADIIDSNHIQFGVDVKTKKKALQLVSELLVAKHDSLNDKEIYHDLLDRERLGSTYVGYGIAIPHCKNSHITSPIACILRLKDHIDFSSSNDQKVNLLFGLVMPIESHDENIKVLAKITKLIDNQKFREKLLSISNPDEILETFNDKG